MVRSEKPAMVENALRSTTSSPSVKSVMTTLPGAGRWRRYRRRRRRCAVSRSEVPWSTDSSGIARPQVVLTENQLICTVFFGFSLQCFAPKWTPCCCKLHHLSIHLLQMQDPMACACSDTDGPDKCSENVPNRACIGPRLSGTFVAETGTGMVRRRPRERPVAASACGCGAGTEGSRMEQLTTRRRAAFRVRCKRCKRARAR